MHSIGQTKIGGNLSPKLGGEKLRPILIPNLGG